MRLLLLLAPQSERALLVESGFVEVTQPKQFPVQRSVTADPNEIFASSVIPAP